MSEGTIFFEWAPPTWPLAQVADLHRQRGEDGEVRVECLPTGHFKARLASVGSIHEFRFQPVSLRAHGWVKIAFAWNAHEGRFFVGGRRLSSDDGKTQPIELEPMAIRA